MCAARCADGLTVANGSDDYRNAYRHADCDANYYRDRDSYCDSHGNCNSYSHPNHHCYYNCYYNRDGKLDSDSDCHSDRDRNGHSNCDRHGNCDAHWHGISRTDAAPSRANMVVGITLGRAVTDARPRSAIRYWYLELA